MLVGMTKDVSVSVAVGTRVRTGVCELVTEGMVGMGIVAESLGVALAVADTLTEAGADCDTDKVSDAERVVDGTTDRVSDADADADTVPEADTEIDADAEGTTVADSVALEVAETGMLALLRAAEEIVAVWDSEAGIEDGMLRVSLAEMMALEDTPVPMIVDEAMKPEETSVPDRVKVGRIPEDADKDALAGGVALSVLVGSGAERLIEPDRVAEGRMPDDRRPEENSDATLDAMLLKSEVGIGRGIDAVGRTEAVIAEERADSALDTRLETTLGRADPVGKSETADERRLDSSEITDGTSEGSIPDAEGVIVADTGAVGLADPELGMMPVGSRLSDGNTPVTSETTDERIEGKFTSPELAETPSEVGIAPEAPLVRVADADAAAESVPMAVVIPIVIPLEARPLEGRAPVGTTPLLGRIPDSTSEVAVGSTLPRRDDSKEPTRPVDEVG